VALQPGQEMELMLASALVFSGWMAIIIETILILAWSL
jgi:hypothetical protein